MSSLIDQLIRFRGETGRILGGCAFEFPVEVLDLLADIPADCLIDEVAIRFIRALQERRGELEAAETLEQQIDIAIRAAGKDLVRIYGYLPWPDDGDVIRVARDAIQDIKEFPIAERILTRLARYMDSERRYQLEAEHEPPPAPGRVTLWAS